MSITADQGGNWKKMDIAIFFFFSFLQNGQVDIRSQNIAWLDYIRHQGLVPQQIDISSVDSKQNLLKISVKPYLASKFRTKEYMFYPMFVLDHFI